MSNPKQEQKKDVFGGGSSGLFGGSSKPASGGLFSKVQQTSLFGGNPPASNAPPLFASISPNASLPSNSGQSSLFSNTESKNENKVNVAGQLKADSTSQQGAKKQQKSEGKASESVSLFGNKAPSFGFGNPPQGGQTSSLFGNIGKSKDEKKEAEGDKKTEKQAPIPVFGKVKQQTPAWLSNPPNPPNQMEKKTQSLFGQAMQKAQKDDKKSLSGGLFGSKKQETKSEEKKQGLFSGMFGQPVVKEDKAANQAGKEKESKKNQPELPSIFKKKSNEEPKNQNKGQKKQEGLNTSIEQSSKKGTLNSLFGDGNSKPGSLFGNITAPEKKAEMPVQPLLLSKQKEQKNEKGNVEFSFAKSSQEEPKNDKKQEKQAEKTEQKQPILGQSLFGGNNNKSAQTPGMSSLFSNSKKTELPGKEPQGVLSEFPPSNVDQSKRNFSYPDKKVQDENDKKKGTITTGAPSDKRDTLAAPSELRSSKITQSVTVEEPQSAPQAMKPTQSKPQQSKPFLETIKPKPTSKKFIDYKTLRHEELQPNFTAYLNQKKSDLIETVKVFFSTTNEKYEDVKIPDSATEKERFYKDLTNLLMRQLSISKRYFSEVESFIVKVIVDQKYEAILFKGDKLSTDFFNENNIYWKDYQGNCMLNINHSSQLRHLAEKLIQKWFNDKNSYLSFLERYQRDMMSAKDDLFGYLFRMMLSQAVDKKLVDEVTILANSIEDYKAVILGRLTQLLENVNSKLGKNYRMLGNNADKFICDSLRYIERIDNQVVLRTFLKIVVTALRLNHPQNLSDGLVKELRVTRSISLLPLRVIVAKLKQGKLDFAPSPKDLYRFIKGDEWLDWIDLYLNCNQKYGSELLQSQPQYLVESLASIRGELLIEKLISGKKGISKFFDMLKEENMVDFYYTLLESCLYNEESIKKIQEFYFKKVNFSLQYQEIIEYIINFHQNLGKPPQELTNQSYIFATMYPKISLLTKILNIEPEKLFEVQKYIFYPDYNSNKRYRSAESVEEIPRQGHKLVHIFIDIIKIVALKGLTIKIIPKVFDVLTSLLKNRKTESIVISATNISQPHFGFLAKQDLPHQTYKSLLCMFDHILNCSYTYDLIIKDNSPLQAVKADIFYPLRYNNTQFSKLMSTEQVNLTETFSIQWIHQLFGAISRQKFDPYILNKLLSKLNITPHQKDWESQGDQYGIRKYSKVNRDIPRIFEMVVNLVNSYAIWVEITNMLEYKVYKEDGKFMIVNKHSNSETGSHDNYRAVFSTLKLLKTIFTLAEVLRTYQAKCPNHFVVKTLSSINVLSKAETETVLSQDKNKDRLLLSLLAAIDMEQPLLNDSPKKLVLESEEDEQAQYKRKVIQKFLQNNHEWLDFEQASNFVRKASDKYNSCEDNITSLALYNIAAYLRMRSDCSLEFTLLHSLNELTKDQQVQMKLSMMDRLDRVLVFYVRHREFAGIKHKILGFIYDLKYGLGQNRFNGSLGDHLLTEVMKVISREKVVEPRICYILMKLLNQEIRQKSQKFQKQTEFILQNFAQNFSLRNSEFKANAEIQDTKEISQLLEYYHGKQYALLNFNQIERMIDEKAIIEIGEQLLTLAWAVEIGMNYLTLRKYSSKMRVTINMLNKIIAEKNLPFLQNDVPFQYISSPKWSEATKYVKLQSPKEYIRDSLELFLSKGQGLKEKRDIQKYQKNNLIEWFTEIAELTSSKLSTFLMVGLSIDRTFYSNNPISYNQIRGGVDVMKPLFCHLSLGSASFSAIEIFGKDEKEAVGVVELISQNILQRLAYLNPSGQLKQNEEEYRLKLYIQGLEMLGFCLEWLRNKTGGRQQASMDIVKRISHKYQCLLPATNSLLIRQQIKVLQSFLSMGQQIPNLVKFEIHHHVFNLIEQYIHYKKGRVTSDAQNELALLLQQVFSLLIVCPPAQNEGVIFQIIIDIWAQEPVQKFFFNQSRLLLELCTLYPEEMAKFKLLSKCKVIDPQILTDHRYREDQRLPEAMSWLWTLKIATALVSNSQSVLVVEEAGNFLINHKDRIYKILDGSEMRVTKAYLEDLQGVLELLIALFSNNIWVSKNSTLMQELTYILSHHLVKLFVGIAQGRVPSLIMSKNEKVLSEVKISSSEKEDVAGKYNSDYVDNLFSIEMKIKTSYCLKVYLMAMEKAFRVSQYENRYFKENVYCSNKYLSSFWDSFNKNLIVLMNYCNGRVEYWRKMKQVKRILTVLNQCYQAPHTFESNGYLTSIIELPQSEEELFNEQCLLCFLVGQLSVVHYLKQKKYIGRHNTLLASSKDTFRKKVFEHIEKAKKGKTWMVDEGVYNQLTKMIQN